LHYLTKAYSRQEKKFVFEKIFAVFDNEKQFKKPTISVPYNPIHISHVGYCKETGEFTGTNLYNNRYFNLSSGSYLNIK
jgi:hypothetical protein